ncbi:hypothetical protein EV683_12730 [Crenobacter luteus]|uniref:hypothetical protein n=1 Tax=Crenobacter luteus TaxID=1452487 RepID=UPI001048129B|nr:hypothetical protein [Crenobacter luteus]TCP09427.1 hypothetical protein EV683_12730 [Crenobacter luteus]
MTLPPFIRPGAGSALGDARPDWKFIRALMVLYFLRGLSFAAGVLLVATLWCAAILPIVRELPK